MFQHSKDRLLSSILTNYILPIPSMTVLSPSALLFDRPIEIDVTSDFLAEGLWFKPLWPVVLSPLSIDSLQCDAQGFTMRISSAASSVCVVDRFQWFLNPGDINVAYLYLQALTDEALSVELVVGDSVFEASMNALGFSKKASLLPKDILLQQPVQWLRELFLFPKKFLFFELNFEAVSLSPSELIELRFAFKQTQSPFLPQLSIQDVILNAFPVVNRFKKVPLAKTQSAYEPYLIDYLEPRPLKSYSVLSLESLELKDEATQAHCSLTPFFPADHSDGVVKWRACHTFSASMPSEWQTKILFDLPDTFESTAVTISSTVIVTQASHVLDKSLQYHFASNIDGQSFISLPVFHPAYCPAWSASECERFYVFLFKGFSTLLHPGEHRDSILRWIALLLPVCEAELIESALTRFTVSPLLKERRIGSRYMMLEGVSISFALNERMLGMAKAVQLCYWLRYLLFEQISLSRVLKIECHLLLCDCFWFWEAPNDLLA